MDKFINNGGLIVIMLCSLIYCFFGYRFFKYLLSLAGAIIFGSVAWSISIEQTESNLTICIPVAIVAALIGAWLFHKLFKFACFLYGAAAGFSLSPVIMTFIENDAEWIKYAVPVGCALVGGILLVFSHRVLLIIMTSSSGAMYFAISLYVLLVEFKVFDPEVLTKPDTMQRSLWFFCFAIAFLSGLFYQLKDKESAKSES